MTRTLWRVTTWNVRRLQDVDAALAVLRPLRPALLALNEVDIKSQPDGLARLACELDLPHIEFYGHVLGGQYGNALLARSPIVRRVATQLDGGTEVKLRDGSTKRIVRGLLVADLAGFRVAVTHLDHMAEAQRVTQMKHLLSLLDASEGGAPPTLLLGDLNALDGGDYSPAAWAEHERHNSASGWGPPADSAAEGGCLHASRRAGFTDCARLLLRPPPSDAWTCTPWTAHRHREGPSYRIDYVHYRAGVAGGAAELRPVAASVDPAPLVASDHWPVSIDFEMTSAASGKL